MNFSKYLLLVLAYVFTAQSCKTTKKQTVAPLRDTVTQVILPYDISPNGVKYKIHKEGGRNAKVGDIVEVNLVNRNFKDSILFSTYETGSPLPIQITRPEYSGDLMDALMLLSEGDSATVWLSVDSLRDFQPIKGVLEKGTFMRYSIKVVGIYTMEEYQAKLNLAGSDQLAKDTLIIKKYLTDNKIKNYKRTASGLYYVIDSKGQNPKVKPANGKKVKVHYTGTLLDGQKFDSSLDRGQPFEFHLGLGQVIRGWDEGIALLSKGSKARLFIPSQLGYGAQGAGGVIPANAVLIFDVELIDF